MFIWTAWPALHGLIIIREKNIFLEAKEVLVSYDQFLCEAQWRKWEHVCGQDAFELIDVWHSWLNLSITA